MPRTTRWLPLGMIFLLLCCFAALALPVEAPLYGGAGSSGGVHSLGKRYASGAHPPPGAACPVTGIDYPENPFRGWPVARYEGDWRTISSWFCDPDYFHGQIHSGIDLASRIVRDSSVKGGAAYYTLDEAPVVSTAIKAVVVGAANNGGHNHGMGNFALIRHVTCDETCGSKPVTPAEGQHVFVLESSSLDCPHPTPVAPGPDYKEYFDDRLLDCRESGWKASYFHLKDIEVTVGELVEYGDVLGWIDNTGNSTGPHLHYQINLPTEEGGRAIDPAPAMCRDYNDGLRGVYQWNRWLCAEIDNP